MHQYLHIVKYGIPPSPNAHTCIYTHTASCCVHVVVPVLIRCWFDWAPLKWTTPGGAGWAPCSGIAKSCLGAGTHWGIQSAHGWRQKDTEETGGEERGKEVEKGENHSQMNLWCFCWIKAQNELYKGVVFLTWCCTCSLRFYRWWTLIYVKSSALNRVSFGMLPRYVPLIQCRVLVEVPAVWCHWVDETPICHTSARVMDLGQSPSNTHW